MPIGKDSITKRVAKTVTTEEKTAPAKEAAPVKPIAKEEKIAPELVATTAAAPTPKQAPVKKTADGEKKPAAPVKKPAAKKAAPKKETVVAETLTPPAEAPEIATGVLANVSPETVAAVIGHKEDEKYEKVQIGQKMPDFLL